MEASTTVFSPITGIEYDVTFEFSYWCHHLPARTSGPPEQCHPEEWDEEFIVEDILEVSPALDWRDGDFLENASDMDEFYEPAMLAIKSEQFEVDPDPLYWDN